ncbi:MAG: hypothetical protein LBQ54_14415 [Planctomycetaceae bacterium]|jgi:hypothetical protein|nr:hypothetical protein [Planctomycetaceae bacterium]
MESYTDVKPFPIEIDDCEEIPRLAAKPAAHIDYYYVSLLFNKGADFVRRTDRSRVFLWRNLEKEERPVFHNLYKNRENTSSLAICGETKDFTDIIIFYQIQKTAAIAECPTIPFVKQINTPASDIPLLQYQLLTHSRRCRQ